MVLMLPGLMHTFGDPINVVELGMHGGSDTCAIYQALMRTGRRWNYVALEPDPRIQPRVPPGVVFVRAAIADHDGVVKLHLSDGVSDEGMHYTGSSSTRPPGAVTTLWPKMTFNEVVDVEAITLDTLCTAFNLQHIDFIWCDTQGCEIDAIRGGKRMMPLTKWFFTEYANGEIYKGQADFAQLIAALPFMDVHTDMLGDALFKNKAVTT